MAKKDWMVSATDIDDDQYKILNAVLDKSCIVSGCAGSGKSVLALLKAQRIQKEKGTNYQIIVFTKALCNYMNAGRKELGLTNTFKYHHQWANRDGCPSSDYIIVDEIQDFDKEEIRQFVSSTNKNFFFFGDTAQSIYGGLRKNDGSVKVPVPVDNIVKILPTSVNPKSFELYRNYRLPIPVAKLAQCVGVDLDPFVESVYKSKVKTVPRFLKSESLESQLQKIKEIIEKRNFSDVAILLPDNKAVVRTHKILNQIGLNHEAKYKDEEDWRNNVETLNFNTTNPKLMTYHSAKGLQFEAVFLPEANLCNYSSITEKDRSQRKALYVAMTRTYNYLYVLYTGSLGSSFQRVQSELYQTSDIDMVNKI